MAEIQYVPDVGELFRVLTENGPLTDPLSIALIAVGGLLVTASVAVFGGLSFGAVLGLIGRSVE